MVKVKKDADAKPKTRSLVALLGLDGEAMRWEALLVLLLAGWLAGVFVKLVYAALYGGDLTSLTPWINLAAHSLLQAALLGVGLRWLRRDLRAAALAAVGLGIVWPLAVGMIEFGMPLFSLWLALPQVTGGFLLVVGLAIGLRMFKVDAPALVIGGALGKGLSLAAMGLLGQTGFMAYADPIWMETPGAWGMLGMGSGAWPQVVSGGIFGLVLWGAGKLLPVSEPA